MANKMERYRDYEGPRCGECLFWHAIPEQRPGVNNSSKAARGECHGSPPTVFILLERITNGPYAFSQVCRPTHGTFHNEKQEEDEPHQRRPIVERRCPGCNLFVDRKSAEVAEPVAATIKTPQPVVRPQQAAQPVGVAVRPANVARVTAAPASSQQASSAARTTQQPKGK